MIESRYFPDRKILLADIDQRIAGVLALSSELERATDELAISEKLDKAQSELGQLYDIYEESLTRLPVSRCPLTGKEVILIVDDTDLDGPYWDCERPIRPVQQFPETVAAYTGSINMDTCPEDMRHGILPGPGKPYVVPRLLNVPGMKAAVSKLKIGEHDAYVTFYFHRDPLYDLARVNTWGTKSYIGEWQKNCSYVLTVPDLKWDYDFELEPWIGKGMLFWIEPGDETLQLKSTAFDCPYLNLDGREFPVYCRNSYFESTLELTS